MEYDPEVRVVAQEIASHMAHKHRVPEEERRHYVENMWPAWASLAQDIVVLLLGADYELHGVVEDETSGNGCTPFVVCSNDQCSGEC